jgi:hypothetical protein
MENISLGRPKLAVLIGFLLPFPRRPHDVKAAQERKKNKNSHD